MILEAALALVCQFSQPLCDTAKTVQIAQAQHYPDNRLVAWGWADAGHIWYVPQATHNPALSDTDEQFLVIAKEAQQARQTQAAPFIAASCQQQETAGHTTLAEAWTWLWEGHPPRVAYNDLENAAVADASSGGIGIQANVLYTCTRLFG
jgi:hypothetical protein